jgi:hypothetical protein
MNVTAPARTGAAMTKDVARVLAKVLAKVLERAIANEEARNFE